VYYVYLQGAGGLQARMFTTMHAEKTFSCNCVNKHAFSADELVVSKGEV
jgi:hypothetical protein